MTIPFWTAAGTIDLAALRPEDLTAEIIGDTLAKINRFGGRTATPWSVAAHSVLVERLSPLDLAPWALLHDAHEAFLGDLTRPALEVICRSGTRSAVEHAVRNAKGRLDRQISHAWGVTVRSLNLRLRQADHAALQAEALVFLGIRPEVTGAGETDMAERATSLLLEMLDASDWRTARGLWLSRVSHYAGLGLLSPPRASDPTGAVPAEHLSERNRT